MAEPKYPNPFKQFSTMSYGVSIYMMDDQRFNRMVATQEKDVTGLELLIQSGGANAGETALANVGNFGAKRNRFWKKDFYLDDIQLESYVSGTSTGGPSNTFQLNFSVTEPAGLSFVERLYRSAEEFNANLGRTNFNPTRQVYLMVIRFYGYDVNGKQVLNGKFDKTSDPQAFNEKWIPFMINRISFSIESNVVVYNCECTTPQGQVGFSQVHGTLPYNIALQGKNLGELLDGTNQPNTSGVRSTGLMYALNENQKRLAKECKYDIADQYAIEFEDEDMRRSALAGNGTIAIQRTAMPGKATGEDLTTISESAKTISNTQTFALDAGMKIVRALDLAIRSSEYIYSQYRKVNDPNRDNSTVFQQENENKLDWFKIRPRVEIIDFDRKRQDWAYKITYVVSRYEIRSTETRDFKSKDCVDIQKEYDFWFTGKNTEVLEFKQDYNNLYYQTFSSKHKENPNEAPGEQRNLRTMSFYRPNSNQAHTGEKLIDEQAANVASVLYSPGDNVNCEIDIVGDPDWLSQSEIFYSAAANSSRDARLVDGSINHDTAEVFFAVNFNTVVDYDLNTGVADVTAKNLLQDPAAEEGGVSQYSFLYRANTITTQLSQGRFVQQLQGSLIAVPESCVIGKEASKKQREEKETEPQTAKGDQLNANCKKGR